ncbi:hypothetical protein GCM10007916_06110 [Psychromonas marina]|uniref:Type IV pilus modification protein PilV n=1 Tax=Psychromonas marina TaxID=88364 RepID=A0ABQ6DX15_9GAMM|nr:type IV pilus modification protein PilV [Psychromonas marina]GLS89544.1 hypothetical protein GCM10007916_06110 [Psychromonas marina]
MNTQKGTTLIEVLIALFIVAIGVLGHAKMQMKSMDVAQQASFSQVANTALLDLSQRMRANADLASDFVVTNLANGNDIAANVDCSAAVCTNAQFAQSELAEWFNHLQNNLPSPRFSVEQSTDLYTLTLIWDTAQSGTGTAGCVMANDDSYKCGSMEVWIP